MWLFFTKVAYCGHAGWHADIMILLALRGAAVAAVAAAGLEQPNPPNWPSTVQVFGPETPGIGAAVAALYAEMSPDLYTSHRAALLFKPGRYTADVPVGYYTTVHGLGASPADVRFEGPDGVHEAEPGRNLIKFWRSAENLLNHPASGQMVWSVSQAAPLRRMVVDADLIFGTADNTQGSGGYVSGLNLTGKLNFTMQQQWIIRNCELGGGSSFFASPPRAVNFVYVGTKGSPAPSTKCTNAGANPVSPVPQQLVTDATPLSVEKPYLTISDSGKYSLVTPKPLAGTRGVQWAAQSEYIDGFERVFVATNATDVSEINARLADGLHVILSPGIYSLPEPIVIGRSASPYQVLLGLGLATLIPTRRNAAIHVRDVPGVRVAGLLLQAGPVTSKSLITVGGGGAAPEVETDETDPSNPIVLADVYARVGGPGVDPETGLGPAVSTEVMMEINASNVVLDNVWLWRADVDNGKRPRDCNHSLVVNGANVSAYGLAAEHTQSDNVVWNGEGGRLWFFQAELDGLAHTPGDKTPGFGPNGVAGYLPSSGHVPVPVKLYSLD